MKNNKLQKNIPEGWKWKTLGEIGKCIRGVSYAPGDLSNEKNDSNTFLLRANNIKDSHLNLDNVNIVNSAKIKKDQFLQNGDFFICMSSGSRDLVGKNFAYYGEEKYTVGSFCAIYRPNNLEQAKFLTHFFRSDEYIEQIQNALAGTSINNLKNSNIENLKILMPPIDQQNNFANILGSIDEQIEKVDDVIKKTEELKKGLMQELFTKGIGHTKFKKTKLGMIPEEWEVAKLERVAQVERGKFSQRPRNDPAFYGGSIPFIQTGNVVNCNGIISNYNQTLNEKGLSVSRMFKKGTIVLTIAANIGDTGILEFDSCFPDSLVGINVNDDMNNVFIEYYLRTKKKFLDSSATQSAQKNINLEKLRPLLVIKPKKEEQEKIAKILSDVDEKISINKQIKEKLTDLKKGLMQDLLSGKVRV